MKVIGIAALHSTVSTSEQDAVSKGYIEAIRGSGAIPLLLPNTMVEEELDYYMGIVDGIIIPGGYDVNPYYYNEDCLEKLGYIDNYQDECNLKLIDIAVQRNKPILGICRGLQILNVYFGGSLYQDLSYMKRELSINHAPADNGNLLAHEVSIQPSSLMSDLWSANELYVNSSHHQCIKGLAEGFTVTMRANDGVIEGIEHASLPIIAVQFHPERMYLENDSFAKYFFLKFVEWI